MIDPAKSLYDSLSTWQALDNLVSNAEPEGPYLECKSVGEPRLQQGQRGHLAQALSGFTNTSGGVVLWGASTTKQAHTGLDVITQLEPFGNSRSFQKQVDVAMSGLAYPPVTGCESKTVHPSVGATKGVVITHIPPTHGDPVQALAGERRFWLRSGAEFVEMPYEVLKRMFAAVASPDLRPRFDSRLITKTPSGDWSIPIIVDNESSAVAERVQVNVAIKNPGACERVAADTLTDSSKLNPGQKIFMRALGDGVIHRGLSMAIGTLEVGMKKGKLPKRVLTLEISIFANRMRARRWTMTVQLASKGFSVKKISDRFLY